MTNDSNRALVHNNEIDPGKVRNGKVIACWHVTDTTPSGERFSGVKRAVYSATVEFTDGSRERVLTHG